MSGNEQVKADLDWMRRRSVAAAPAKHPLRTAACPALGALARGGLTDEQRRHVEGCRHCRAVGRAAASEAARLSRWAAPAGGALAAALLIGAWLQGWTGGAPARFEAPVARPAAPPPAAVEADWPAPLHLRAPGAILPAPRTTPPLPEIRPLERFRPPERRASPTPLAVLMAPEPPALNPAPPPDLVGLLGLRVL